MIYIATLVALGAAILAHVLRVPGFTEQVSIPITPLVIALAFGVIARLLPKMRKGFAKIVPAWVPRPDLVVWASGAIELAGAIGLLIPGLRVWAASLLAIFFIAIFPANVKDAQRRAARGGNFARIIVPRALLQVLFVGLCVWVVIAEIN